MTTKIIIASGPVIVEHGKVLLDIQGNDNFWKFCGGRVRDDESLAETAQRRSGEELGINIEILDEVPFIMHTKKTDEGGTDIILAHFLARRIHDVKPGPEVREWRWHDIDNLPENLGTNIIPALKHFGYIK